MPDNVAASMTASIVLDKSDLLAQILKGLSEGQKELQNNKLEMYFDFSNSKNQAEFEKVIQKYRKQLSSQEFVVQIKDQGIDETVKSLDKLVEVVKSLASGKAFGTGSGNGKGIGNSIVDEKQLKTVINLFEKMESHLSSMRKVISDVGDGDEFSPLLTMINKVDSSISELAKKTSSLSLNMNLDFGSDDKITAEVQSRTAKLLHTYENLFNRLKMSGTLDSNMQGYFDNFDINQYDNMNAKIAAYKNFITEMREMSKQQFGKDYLYSDIEKSYYSAVSGAQRSLNNVIKSESTSNNSIENLFGKTDLSEVISQLTIIVNKLDEISTSANNFTKVFKNGLDVNTSIQEVIDLTNRVKELEIELAKIKNATSATVSPTSETNISYASVESTTNSIKEENNVLEQNTQKIKENTQAKAQNANVNLNKYDKRLDSYNGKVDKYQATIDRFNDGGWTSDTYLKNVQDVRDAVKQYATLLDNIKTNQNGIATDEDIQNLDKYEKKIKDTIATVTNMSASEKGYSQLAGQKEIDKINKILRENSAMSSEAKAKIKAYKQELISGNPSVSLEKIHGEIMKLVNAEELAGRAGRSMFDVIKEKAFYGFAAQIGMYFGFNDIVNGFKQVASTVIDLNTQITDLAKVSEATSSQIYDDFSSYADIAKDIGGTISDTISATADWSRNGYNLPDSKELARVALLYKNVGDGIDIDTANESLISTLRGFKMEADEAEQIIDIFNNVSNNEPIDSGGIGEALQRSAASFNAANTSLQESVALISTTNSVIQNPEKVGNMWKVVSMRIRSATSELEQAGEDTDGLVTSTADLQKMIKAMTGYDILESDGKTFKSIYDIVLNISKVWNNLSDLDQSSLLQALAGKQQSNALAAALSNSELLEKSYQEAMDSAGSAAEEEKKYQQSVQYSIDQTKAKLEELSADLLSSDFLKGAIDAGGKLIDILDGIVKSGNAIPAVATAIAAAFSFKNVGIDTLVAY